MTKMKRIFGTGLIMRRWYVEFKKDSFPRKLAEAKKILTRSMSSPLQNDHS